MMNDKFFRSISAITQLSELATRHDKMFGNAAGISLAIEKSTRGMMGVQDATRHVRGVIAMLDSPAWMKQDFMAGYPNFAKVGMAANIMADFPKLPTVPKWILDLNNPTNNALGSVFTAYSNLQSIIPIIPENSAVKNAMDMISGMANLNAASRGIANMTKISESILRFDSNVKSIYKFINEFDGDDEEEFQIDINGQLTTALTYDIDNANSEEKIAITYVVQYFLDTFNTMYGNYKSGKDKELFVKWITTFLDNLKSSGVRVAVIKVMVVVVPLLFSIKEVLKEDKAPNETNYITESPFQTTTTAIKFLKEAPDNRYKTKFTIPVATKLTVLQDNGKWIKVKFTSGGIYYKGWTLNSDIK